MRCLPSSTGVPMPVCVKIPPSPCPPGADAFDQGTLRNKLHLQFASHHHLSLGFGIETDVAHDGFTQLFGLDELPDAPARHRGVIRDHGKVALVLAHDLVNDTLGRADGHETADHQRCAVGDHGDRLIKSDGSHGLVEASRNARFVGLTRRSRAWWYLVFSRNGLPG
jgi:hypothetical protein